MPRSLEDRIAALEQENERLKAVHEIQNVMGLYTYYHCSGKFPEHVQLWANREDSSVHISDWGYWKGIKGVKRLYADVIGGSMTMPGFLYEHTLTTPIIEVARDGKTAKGVWLSPGHDTIPNTETGEIKAGWVWLKFGADFIKEHGEWKIWHLFVFLTLYADFYKSWVENGAHPDVRLGETLAPELAPDCPPILRNEPYDIKRKPAFLPAFPEPYDSYDEELGVFWMDPVSYKKTGSTGKTGEKG